MITLFPHLMTDAVSTVAVQENLVIVVEPPAVVVTIDPADVIVTVEPANIILGN